MISWGTIFYGAGLSVVFAALALMVLAGERSVPVLGAALVATLAAPIAWNAILHSTHASEFFTNAPLALFPISWQDTGSGVFTLALAVVLLTAVRPNAKSARTLFVAMICALVALLVDIYLY